MSLVEKLKSGCIQAQKRWSGDCGEMSLVDEHKTDAVMAEAAKKIEELQKTIDALRGGDDGMSAWKEMESVPNGESVLLFNRHSRTMWIGRKRYGRLGEPQQDSFAWRCDSSGRFHTPTHWAPKPKEPKEVAE